MKKSEGAKPADVGLLKDLLTTMYNSGGFVEESLAEETKNAAAREGISGHAEARIASVNGKESGTAEIHDAVLSDGEKTIILSADEEDPTLIAGWTDDVSFGKKPFLAGWDDIGVKWKAEGLERKPGADPVVLVDAAVEIDPERFIERNQDCLVKPFSGGLDFDCEKALANLKREKDAKEREEEK